MVSERETANIRRFVCGQLSQEADLSTLTLGILKKRYLAQVGCDSLSPEARTFMKQVVQEQLMKMQDDDNSGSELETKETQKKRKREKENDEGISDKENESRAKKSRVNRSSSSSESEEKEDCKTGSEQSYDEEQIQSDDAEQEVKKMQPKTNGKSKQQISSDDSSDEEDTKSGKRGNKSNSPKETVKKKENTVKNGETRSSKTREGKKTPQSDEENDSDSDSTSERSDKINSKESSDDSGKEGKVSVEKKKDDTDSDSSSLPSLEDEKDDGKENVKDEKKNKKKKTVKKEENSKGQRLADKAVVRLKRYISLCGVRRNYKKLLDGCHSVRSKLAVLKKELEDLGVQGQPTIEKCKKVRMKRETAQEIAELDVSNIITTQGRPKRRQAWQQNQDPPSSVYKRSLNSGSDSDQEQNTRRKVTEWANLRGIISDDADSD